MYLNENTINVVASLCSYELGIELHTYRLRGRKGTHCFIIVKFVSHVLKVLVYRNKSKLKDGTKREPRKRVQILGKLCKKIQMKNCWSRDRNLFANVGNVVYKMITGTD